MKLFTLLKHKNNTDVAIKPISVTELDGEQHISVYWYNIVNPRNIYKMVGERIIIKDKDLKNWEIIKV